MVLGRTSALHQEPFSEPLFLRLQLAVVHYTLNNTLEIGLIITDMVRFW